MLPCKRCCVVLAAQFGLVSTMGNEAAQPSPAGWKQAWSDEFDGKEIDKTKWDFDIGNYDANQ